MSIKPKENIQVTVIDNEGLRTVAKNFIQLMTRAPDNVKEAFATEIGETENGYHAYIDVTAWPQSVRNLYEFAKCNGKSHNTNFVEGLHIAFSTHEFRIRELSHQCESVIGEATVAKAALTEGHKGTFEVYTQLAEASFKQIAVEVEKTQEFEDAIDDCYWPPFMTSLFEKSSHIKEAETAMLDLFAAMRDKILKDWSA